MRWVGRRARASAGENVAYSVGQRVKTERRNAEESLGNNQEFLAQDFQLQFLSQERRREVGHRSHQ